MTLRPLPSFRLLRKCGTVAAFLLAGLGGCSRKATEFSEYAPFTGRVPLTIRGVWPGQNGTEVISLLGPPDRRDASGYGAESLQWQRLSNMVVTLDTSAGRVAEVLGDVLTSGDNFVIEKGMSEADVQVVLGKPAKDRVHYQPSGSGVISLGKKRTGRTFWYRRDERTIEIAVLEERVAYVRLSLPPP
jgi:hypothetical protein